MLAYLFKSGIAITVFYVIYWLVLRNETAFKLNRFILLTGIIVSFIFPLFDYELPFGKNEYIENIQVAYVQFAPQIQQTTIIATPADNQDFITIENILITIYLCGAALFLTRLLYQIFFLLSTARKLGVVQINGIKMVVAQDITNPFSFFNLVFIDAEQTAGSEFERIALHEQAHIQQKHFIDLLLAEIATIIMWFNPVIWLFEQTMKEVHEYLADEAVLKSGCKKAAYQAVLVNQAIGYNTFNLTNSFNSLIKKRLTMMTKVKKLSRARLKALLMIPVVGLLIFVFANPAESAYLSADTIEEIITSPVAEIVTQGLIQHSDSIIIKGKVVDAKTNKPLSGAYVKLNKTSTVVITDNNGGFVIEVENFAFQIAVGCYGYQSKNVEVVNVETLEIALESNLDQVADNTIKFNFRNTNGSANVALFIVDGKVVLAEDFERYKPEDIIQIDVRKDEDAIKLYGEAGKNGVIIVTTKGSKQEIKGHISDAKTGEPIYKASIIIAGTTVGTISDQNGDFKIYTGEDDAELVISYIGYVSYRKKIEKNNQMDIKLEPSSFNIKFNQGNQLQQMQEDKETKIVDNDVYTMVETLPSFKGGTDALLDYFQKNENFPEKLNNNKIMGDIMVSFVVNTDGKIGNVELVSAKVGYLKTSADGNIETLTPIKESIAELENEAVNLVRKMPDWKPGIQHSKAVKFRFVVPVPVGYNPQKFDFKSIQGLDSN